MSEHPTFRMDNTEGYSDADLVILNRMYAERLASTIAEYRGEEDGMPKHVFDNIQDLVLQDFDAGLRGMELRP